MNITQLTWGAVCGFALGFTTTIVFYRTNAHTHKATITQPTLTTNPSSSLATNPSPVSTNSTSTTQIEEPTDEASAETAVAPPETLINASEYDTQLIKTIQHKWQDLLAHHSGFIRSGKVTVTFQLQADGKIGEVQILKSGGFTLDVIGQQAVTQSAPFAPWPAEMQRTYADHTRTITFTFTYQ
jgi:TonB family protein